MMLLSLFLNLGLLQAAAGFFKPGLRMACDPKNTQCDQPSLGREVTFGILRSDLNRFRLDFLSSGFCKTL